MIGLDLIKFFTVIAVPCTLSYTIPSLGDTISTCGRVQNSDIMSARVYGYRRCDYWDDLPFNLYWPNCQTPAVLLTEKFISGRQGQHDTIILNNLSGYWTLWIKIVDDPNYLGNRNESCPSNYVSHTFTLSP